MNQARMQLFDSLKAIFLHIDNREKLFLADYGLNVPRFFVLFHLNQNPGITNMELSDRLLCTKSNTSRIVQGMVKDALIQRVGHPEDRRSFQLYLTEKGKALFDQVQPVYTAKIDDLMSLIDNDKLDHYLEVSQSIEHILAPETQVPSGESDE